MIRLTNHPIDLDAVITGVRSPAAGAVVVFLGTARQSTGGRLTGWLEFEAYPEMVEKELAALEDEARRRWNLIECAVAHRLGRVEIGEICVAIAVSSAHRQAAFEAGKWLIDEMKRTVPIWKCENWTDGSRDWVHPGLGEEGPGG